jgi:hypothetical protein
MTVVRSGRPRAARLLSAVVWLAMALLSACGGDDIPPPGTPVLTIATTNVQFASYIVAIDSITLSGPNGVYAVQLGTTETVDLTRLTDIGELVNAPAVPSGTYTSATVTLDYTNATIYANRNGISVPLALSLPGNAAGIFTTTVVVTFDPAHPLVITLGQGTRVHLNLDLDAFNSIDDTTVTVMPYAVMSTPPLDTEVVRARGIFVYTETGTSFVINMRPFYDLSSALGALTVNVNDQTYYNVQGLTYIGAEGLAAMTDAPISTPVAVYGTLSSLAGITPQFTATTVLVGTSLESPIQDHLTGVVSYRSGDSLILKHVQYRVSSYGNADFTAGSIAYLTAAYITVGSGTIVSADGIAASFSTGSISVGQVVDIGGTATIDPTIYSVSLDATAGQVRLLDTKAWGVFGSATASTMSLDLLSLDGQAIAAFDFSGTATGGGAVNPAQYPVDTGTIDTVGTAPGTLLALDGIMNAFGSAPPAYLATAVTPGTQTQQELIVEWNGTYVSNPFSTINGTGLVIDLDNAAVDSWHYLYTGPQSLDLKSLPASPLITTAGADPTQILMSVGDQSISTGMMVFSDQTTFITTLYNDLKSDANKMFRLVAIGQYNAASNTFVATRISVAFQQTPATTT